MHRSVREPAPSRRGGSNSVTSGLGDCLGSSFPNPQEARSKDTNPYDSSFDELLLTGSQNHPKNVMGNGLPTMALGRVPDKYGQKMKNFLGKEKTLPSGRDSQAVVGTKVSAKSTTITRAPTATPVIAGSDLVSRVVKEPEEFPLLIPMREPAKKPGVSGVSQVRPTAQPSLKSVKPSPAPFPLQSKALDREPSISKPISSCSEIVISPPHNSTSEKQKSNTTRHKKKAAPVLPIRKGPIKATSSSKQVPTLPTKFSLSDDSEDELAFHPNHAILTRGAPRPFPFLAVVEPSNKRLRKSIRRLDSDEDLDDSTEEVDNACQPPSSTSKRSSNDSDDEKSSSKRRRPYMSTNSVGVESEAVLGYTQMELIEAEIDHATLCPFCDELWPENPSINLERLLAQIKRHASRQPRHSNKFGLKAPMATYMSLCQLHRAESTYIPEGLRNGWPKSINFNEVPKRLKMLKRELEEIIKHPSGYFFDPERQLILNRGAIYANSTAGQFVNFAKAQPGYYGEQGMVILRQTLEEMFPRIDPELIHPMEPEGFLTRVLLPEAAVLLIQQDMVVDRNNALEIMHKSVKYGNAMFPDRDGETAGDKVVKERAMIRRKEIEEEEGERNCQEETIPRMANSRKKRNVGKDIIDVTSPTSSPSRIPRTPSPSKPGPNGKKPRPKPKIAKGIRTKRSPIIKQGSRGVPSPRSYAKRLKLHAGLSNSPVRRFGNSMANSSPKQLKQSTLGKGSSDSDSDGSVVIVSEKKKSPVKCQTVTRQIGQQIATSKFDESDLPDEHLVRKPHPSQPQRGGLLPATSSKRRAGSQNPVQGALDPFHWLLSSSPSTGFFAGSY